MQRIKRGACTLASSTTPSCVAGSVLMMKVALASKSSSRLYVILALIPMSPSSAMILPTVVPTAAFSGTAKAYRSAEAGRT